jgi:hypothetical protein
MLKSRENRAKGGKRPRKSAAPRYWRSTMTWAGQKSVLYGAALEINEGVVASADGGEAPEALSAAEGRPPGENERRRFDGATIGGHHSGRLWVSRPRASETRQ